jgi:hypothetical protein
MKLKEATLLRTVAEGVQALLAERGSGEAQAAREKLKDAIVNAQRNEQV